jgi:nucleotide-binding universal stress UspA family protein
MAKAPGSVVLKSNRVSSAITSYAKEKQFDHIVMGIGVTNDMERLFLGSVATEVVSTAHCPDDRSLAKHCPQPACRAPTVTLSPS